AGYPGIYFIAMKWPEDSTDPACIQWLKDAGFDCTSIYHYMSPGPDQPVDYTFDFDKVVSSSLPWCQRRLQTGILPFLPNLSSGWDDRPWNNHLVIANRTVEKFRKICEDMKAYLAESGQKRILIAPVNEWGEGSYIEPNREFGFGMYEALRETFGKKPEGGWPLFYGPTDVGLGPYDYPEEE
ncbi:MAG: glycoside hydrolase family 99-like domain-containing protein, partial [Thermoguttaceae bacterium]|nr:glycoside hydrolase family 99-like domain-containing protein [Thermoguttaceae bacterium]